MEIAPSPAKTSCSHCDPLPASDAKQDRVWNRPLYLGMPVTAFLMIGTWGFHLDETRWYPWIAFFLALIVQIGVGAPFYRNAWLQLQRNRLTMDTLVALGSSAAFALSLYGLLRPGHLHHLYFMEAAAILTLVGIGHWLEARIAHRANATLRGLLTLTPDHARRLKPDGEVEEVPVAQLAVGDLILLKPGDRIPIDGTLFEKHGTVDESMLTGESTPVEKGHDSPVYAGTLNLNRRLVIRVTGIGADTALAAITATVERAQKSRAAIESLVDRVSNVFVLIVVALAFLTFLGWGMLTSVGWEEAILTAVSVLVVACPCALGLATPAALLAASNAAARRGVLFRDATALEKCGRITAVLFDKTGTLTAAIAAIEEVQIHRPGLTDDEFAALALALASPSNHPWSRSVAAHFSQAAQIALEDWHEERGSGVIAQYQGETARLGSAAWLISSGVTVPDATLPRLGSALAISLGKELVGLLFLNPNRPKPEALGVLHDLETGNPPREVHIVSGDTPAVAQALADQLHIPPDHVFAEIRPEQKAEIVIKLQAQGKKVAFVGDGINDAPALAQADLGIAVLGASDIAKESADVILLNRNLEAIPEILQLSAATLRTIHQNLFWAFFYNAAAIPLAMAGMISPVFCALAMGLSDLFVVGNAFRLSRWRGKRKPRSPRH